MLPWQHPGHDDIEHMLAGSLPQNLPSYLNVFSKGIYKALFDKALHGLLVSANTGEHKLLGIQDVIWRLDLEE